MYNKQLETFIQVADFGSFSKAADALYISPTAVMKQINMLEGDMGFTLFERTNRGLVLTEAGKSIYKDARYIIRYSKESVNRAKNAMQQNDRIIRIGTSLMTPSKFIIDLWPKIQKECPNLKFQIVSFENTPENAREILKNLGQNIDIVAGVFDDIALKKWGCNAVKLTDEPICCTMPLSHPLSGKDTLEITDLYGETLMIIKRGFNRFMDDLRDDLWENHSEISMVDFDFYSVNVYNQCDRDGSLIISTKPWENVHPMMKTVNVNWEHTMPFGILHSPTPSEQVSTLLDAVKKVLEL